MLIKIATRNSPLALYQAEFVAAQLTTHHPYITTEIIPIISSGDKTLDKPLYKIGGKSLFIKELEAALLTQEADIAVHSMKDMPFVLPPTLSIAAICKRDDPSDCLVSHKFTHLNQLPPQAIVGTSSLRRQSQILAIRPDLQVKFIRGNIATRLNKLNQDCDAIILATAAIDRLNITNYKIYKFDTETFIPAVAQGAIGVECRADNQELQKVLQLLNHLPSSLCVDTERAMNQVLGGSCHTPIGGHAVLNNGMLTLTGLVASDDGKKIIKISQTMPAAEYLDLAEKVAKLLLAGGADKLLG